MGVLKWNLIFQNNMIFLALAEWLATSGTVKGLEWRVLTIKSMYDYEWFDPESWLQAAFYSRLVHHFVAIGLQKMKSCFWNLWYNRESIRFCDCCSDSRILISKIDSFLFWTGETEYESWKYCGIGEAWNFHLTSCMTSILFSSLNFSSMGWSRKGV